LPKRNYGFEKRQKELSRRQKQEEKRQRRRDRGEPLPPEDLIDPALPDVPPKE
jgi:hypothetical protein